MNPSKIYKWKNGQIVVSDKYINPEKEEILFQISIEHVQKLATHFKNRFSKIEVIEMSLSK